jgi:hypothetical protein
MADLAGARATVAVAVAIDNAERTGISVIRGAAVGAARAGREDSDHREQEKRESHARPTEQSTGQKIPQYFREKRPKSGRTLPLMKTGRQGVAELI